ncbi:MAG: hypothetical protein IPI81_15115 [Flavobacteriales bacterium]|nr:hypothetical protein [Flavobacteriales bacterium]
MMKDRKCDTVRYWSMPRWSVFLGVVLLVLKMSAQSPHGEAFKIDCSACHVPDSWTAMKDPLGFSHDSTAMPLIGVHARIDCRSCHASIRFDVKPASDCIACHADVQAMTVGNDCARCHTPQTWLVDEIPELHEQNGFPLIGAHGNLSCVDCHSADNTLAFARLGNECINCHRADYMATRSPNHTGAGFSTNCDECHDPMGTGWSTAFANHDFFPLTGGHTIQDCAQCHTTGIFADASPTCSSCHQTDYSSSTDPNHTAAGFSTDCATCHNTGPGWNASFDHNVTDFPLHGTHATTDCMQCHANGYAGTPTACSACHIDDYNSTTDPNHATSGFSMDCATCHDETAWGNATFDHNSTGFPLHGTHTTTACIECHANGYAGTPTECSECHMDDYTATTDPNHAECAFGANCAFCHDETSWDNSSFDHGNTGFVLHGAHLAASCNQCHANGFMGTPTTCSACHMADYNSTSDPNHAAAQFPTDCASCHDETNWGNATFDHDQSYFPIYSGHHDNEWSTCAECHTNPSNYSVFTCVDCHEHNNQNSVNDDHNGVNGYSYNSAACYNCHPDGTH